MNIYELSVLTIFLAMAVFTIMVLIVAFVAKIVKPRLGQKRVEKRTEEQNRLCLIPSIYLPDTGIPWDQVVLKRVIFLPRNLLESGFLPHFPKDILAWCGVWSWRRSYKVMGPLKIASCLAKGTKS